MKLNPIVISLLDTDLYKFNMNQVMFHKHTDLTGEYVFKCRNEGVIFTKEMYNEINEQIDHLCELRFTNEELVKIYELLTSIDIKLKTGLIDNKIIVDYLLSKIL